nr:hypothetical protein [Tanacetum cinerariifolium]
IQVAQKKVKIAFENADSSSRVELIPSKIKYANKVVLSFHKEFSLFSSFTRKGNDGLLQDQVFKNNEEVVIKIRFGNDHVAKIMGYGDYKIGNVTISRVYFVEGLGHNLFSVGNFVIQTWKSLFANTLASFAIWMASKKKSWLWHRRLSHLNFSAINHLARQGLIRGLPKLKFEKDHLCSACAMGKKSVNGKKYILVIIDDYSRFTWVKFLRSKDEALDFIIKFLKMIQVRLKVPVHPLKEEILAFIHFLGHSAAIKTLTYVNINKLYQPWRSFAAIINKCLTEKSSGYDSLRLSQAQILWGLYHKRNVDYTYLMWEDFVYQVKHKNQKKSNEMYYPRFTKSIIHHFMSKDHSIPKRNKVNWHYVRDDHMNSKAYKEYYAIATGEAAPKPKASVRRTRSSSDTSITPPTAAASPRLTASTKGKQTAKASKANSLSALSEVAITEAQQLKLVTKRSMQQTYISQPSGSSVDEGTGSKPGVHDVPTEESEDEFSWISTDDEGDDNEENDDDGDEEDEGDDGKEGNGNDDYEDDDGDEGDDDDANQEVVRDDNKNDKEEGGDDEHEFEEDESDEETRDEERFDPIPQTPKNSKDEGNGEEDLGLNVGEEERHVEEEEEDELYRDVNINQGRGIHVTLEVEDSHVTLTPVNLDSQQESSLVSSQFVTSMLNLTLDVGMESIFETTSQLDVQTPTSVALLPMTALTMTPSTIATITTTSQAPILPTIVPSNIIQNLPNFCSLFRFNDRVRSLEANFSEAMQTNQFAGAVSVIPRIVHRYMEQRMNKAVKVVVQIQSDRLRDEAQRENVQFLRTVDENMKKIIKEEQLEAEVLTQSSHSSRTSYAVAADLFKMELKKVLIEKMEGNKSIQHSDEKGNLYKALVDAYESDKIILETYKETVTLTRRRDDDAVKDEEPSTGLDRGPKRRREEKEPETASAPT